MLIIYVWALLALVIVGYVIYRLATDRLGAGKRHPLYPFVSRSSDGMFPLQSGPNAKLTYIALAASLLLFLAMLAFELLGLKSPLWLKVALGPTLLVGLCFMAIGLSKSQRPK